MVARFRIALAETSSLRIMELQLAGSRCEQIMLLRLVCFGLCPCQHNGTYTRNVYPATPTKTPAKILHFAESKSEPLSRKNSGKAAQNRVRKGSSPLILPDTAVGIFLSRLKKWAQKSPEVVETSRLFAAASFLVQLDGGPEETRTLALSDANRTLSRMVQIYAPKILEKM